MNKKRKICAALNQTKRPWYAYNLAEDGTRATIRINGMIGSWGDGRTIDQVDWQLEWAGAVNELTVRITSFGGSLVEALAMYGALRRHPARKIAIIEGVAASAGTIVAMGCDEIRIYANASMMVHGVSLRDQDGEEVADAAAERVLNASIIETYTARLGKTAEEVADAISEDSWMTAREAVAQGWADSVIEIAGSAIESAQASSPLLAIAQALEIPSDVLARAQAQAEEAPEPNPTPSEGGDPPAQTDPPPAGVGAANAVASVTFAAQVNALAVAAGLGDFVSAWLLDSNIATVAQAKAAIAEAREVRDLCAFANAADRLPEFLKGRKSLAEVRAALINAHADAADQAHTDGHPRSSISQPSRAGSKPAVSIASIYSTLNSTARH